MEKENVEEFLGHFDKAELESQLMRMETALTRDTPEKIEQVAALFQAIHSLKGTTAILKIELLNQFFSVYEDALGMISKNIHHLVGVKNTEVFDFFRRGLDLVERVALRLIDNPELIIKNNKELFNLYIQAIVEARELVAQPDQYFEFIPINEERSIAITSTGSR